MLILQSTQLMARLDPQHGGEVIDLIDLVDGRQLLGRPPFGSTNPIPGDLDEPTWSSAYRGGWQMLTPNAGNSCAVEGVTHGFHGRASNDPWEVVASHSTSAHLKWTGHGLIIHRHFTLKNDTLSIHVEIQATKNNTPLIAVEHIALGLQILDPQVSIELPESSGCVTELDPDKSEPSSSLVNDTSWPHARMLDGSIQRVDQWSTTESCSRMLSVCDLAEGRVLLHNKQRDVGLMIQWDHDWLKHLWIWQEVRTTGGPWRELGEMLVIEPASVSHHAGLAHAIKCREALWLDIGQNQQYEIRVAPWRTTHF